MPSIRIEASCLFVRQYLHEIRSPGIEPGTIWLLHESTVRCSTNWAMTGLSEVVLLSTLQHVASFFVIVISINRQGGGIEPLHVSMPHELKSCPSTSLTHPGMEHIPLVQIELTAMCCVMQWKCDNIAPQLKKACPGDSPMQMSGTNSCKTIVGFICFQTLLNINKSTRDGTRTRNLLLRREAPYPLGHTSSDGAMQFNL